MEMQDIVIAIIAIFVGSLLWGALGGSTISSVVNAQNASWSNGSLAPTNAQTVSSVWGSVPIIITISGLMIFVTVIIGLSRVT